MILFVVGPPGVGKTTLVRALIGMKQRELPIGGYLVAKPKWTVCDDVCAAGHYTGDIFDGADTVPYNGVAPALAYWRANLKDKALTIFDGDRFSYAKVVEELRSMARVQCLLLEATDVQLRERRAQRGSTQNASWMKGRETKAHNFAALFDDLLKVRATGDVVGRVREMIQLRART